MRLKFKKYILYPTISIVILAMLSLNGFAFTYTDTIGDVNEGNKLYLNSPVAMAEDTNKNIYIADMSNNRIVVLDENGDVIKKFGTLGKGPGEFDTSFGVAIDNKGNILVADTANYRIQKFDSNWNFITEWGEYGSGQGEFELPREMGIDSQNRYHVCDEFHGRYRQFKNSSI